jgi:hypothetical protein
MNKNFPRSFHPRTLRTTTTECVSLKSHCWGVVREVIGYLELHAKDDCERFAWPHVDDIVKHCARYKGENYNKRAVEYALRFLQRKHAISHRIKRRRYGVLRSGWIVTPHDALCARTEPRLCTPVGRAKAGGTWQRDPESRAWFWIQKGTLWISTR